MDILGLHDLTLKLKNKQWILVLLFTFFIQAAIVSEAYVADTTIKGTTTGDTVVALDVTDSSNTSLLCVRNDGIVGIGTATPGTKLEVNGTIKGIGIMPIGSILAWHKDITGAATLAESNAAGFAVCDGTDTSEVPGAVIATTPNLNGDARFLRGSSTSGTTQSATSHVDLFTSDGRLYFTPTESTSATNWDSRTSGPKMNYSAQGTQTEGAVTYEKYTSRPVNMSVVWIMRVK